MPVYHVLCCREERKTQVHDLVERSDTIAGIRLYLSPVWITMKLTGKQAAFIKAINHAGREMPGSLPGKRMK